MAGRNALSSYVGLVVGAPKRTLGLVALAAIALVACGRAVESQPPTQVATARVESVATFPSVFPTSQPSEVIVKVPRDFQIKLYTGAQELGAEALEFSDLFGQGKPVVLNFWAGLCPPCRAEMPDFQAMNSEFKGQIILIGVDIGPFVGLGDQQDARALIKELGITFPTGYTSESKVVPSYGVLGMPTTVFLTPDGKVQKKWVGQLNKAKMQELIRELLTAAKG